MSALTTRRLVVCTVLASAALGLALLTVSPIINPPKWDEFICVYDAHRVATGQIPYRDFFNFIPPGIFYLLAAVFRAAGASTLTLGRYAALTIALGTALLAVLTLRRRGWATVQAWTAGSLLPICIYPFWAIPSHQWLANLFLVGVFAALAGKGEWFRWVLAGALAGLTLLCLQPQGLLALLGCTLFVLLEEGKGTLRRGLLAAAGLLLIWGPFAILLGAHRSWLAFFRDTVRWPAQNYSRLGNENAGPVLEDWVTRIGDIATRLTEGSLPGGLLTAMAGWVLYVTLAAAGAAFLVRAIVELVRIFRLRRLTGIWPIAAVALTFLQAGLMLRGNLNWLHLLSALFPLLVLWGAACRCRWELWAPRTRRLIGGMTAVCLLAGAAYHARGLWRYTPARWEFADVDRLIRQQPINEFLRSPGILKPGDTLAAFPEGGEVYLYAAPAAVGYTYFVPLNRHYNTLEDHAEVARQIALRRPRLVMMPPELEADYLDEASPVGRLLRTKFHRAGVVGLAVLYEPLAPPP